MRRASRRRTLAYSLLELVVSLFVMAVLMGGLASAIVIVNRAIPDPDGTTSATMEGYYAAERIAGDLFVAQSFTVRTPTAVEFTVADRNHGLPGPETIRYEWSGTAGDPLTVQYNGAPPTDVVPEVYEFELTYGVITQSETTTQEGTVWTDEILLAYFDGWAGVTGTPQSHLLGPGSWDSQYFEVSPPDGVTEFKITRAAIVASHAGSVPEAIVVGIHRSMGDGSYEPASAAIGTTATIPGGALTTMALWHEATFSDVVVKDLSRRDYCLVVKVPNTPPAYVTYLYAKSAPDNGMALKWTGDDGASWDPRSNQIHQYDLRFHVYGSFATAGHEEITIDRYFLTSAGITLRIGSDTATRVQTSVRILNASEVTSP